MKVASIQKLPWKMIFELALEVRLKKKKDIPSRGNSMCKHTKKSESCIFLSTANGLIILEHSWGATEQASKGCTLLWTWYERPRSFVFNLQFVPWTLCYPDYPFRIPGNRLRWPKNETVVL